MKTIRCSIMMALILLYAVAAKGQNLSLHTIYGQYVQFYVVAPKQVNTGSTINVTVVFRQNTRTSPFNKNGDMSQQPSIPEIDGLVRSSSISKRSNEEASKDGATVTSKTYEDRFTYTLLAEKPGTYTLNNIKIVFRGNTLTADPATIVVEGEPALIPGGEEEAKSVDTNKPISVYENPYVQRKSSPRSNIKAIKVYSDRTEVDITYTSRGENVYSSSECYLQDVTTQEHVKMRLLRGDIGYDKKWFASGRELYYTMVFPPIKNSWRNVNVIENVDGGFRFLNVGLTKKPATGSVRKPVEKIDFSNMRRVTLNNYSSDFLFTDGMLPVFNKDNWKWGFYNEQGDKVIDFLWDYDTFRYPHFSGGYCIVSKVYKVNEIPHTDYYTINKAGQPVKLAGVVKVTPFCDGLAAVVKSGGKYTYIKGNGQELSPALTQYIGDRDPVAVRPFVDGLSVYYDYKKKLYGFINKQGAIVISARYEEAHDFSEGLAAVKIPAIGSEAAKWGFIDTRGQMVIPAQYTREPKSFSLGLAVVTKRSGAQVMIDKQGNVVSPDFDCLFPFFSTGYALAKPQDMQGFYVIDHNYAILTGPIYGVEKKHLAYKEHHGGFQTPTFGPGYADGYAYLTTGERMFDTSNQRTGIMSDDLIHMSYSDGDLFVDYDGKAVFQFVQSEF